MYIHVRSAQAADMPSVFDLVNELAIYERAAEEVTTSIDEYQKDLESGWFRCKVAELDGKCVGCMIYYPAYSTWKGRMLYLEDFVVAQESRRKGIGEALWSSLVEEAKEESCTSIKWQVLDWNLPAKGFYQKIGAQLEGGWENGRLWLVDTH